jgi:Ran GTPase-activating protein (RanGAP) involved in mRNA processing and transport
VLLPEGRTPPVISAVEPGIAGGIIETYLAQCDYLNVPPSVEILTHIEDINGRKSRKLKLDSFIGISRDSEFVFNLTPFLAALRHNSYFTILTCKEQSRKEIIPLVADVLANNSTLTSVNMTGVECDEGWGTPIAEALHNKQSAITELVIQNSAIGASNDKAEKASAAFALTLGNLTHSLTTLKLPNTKMQASGLAALFKALAANYLTSDYIEVIDFSLNNFGHAGSIALADWMLRLPRKCLREVYLANAGIEAAPILDAVRTNLSEVITCLDISGSKLEDHSMQILVSFIGRAQALNKLMCVGCDIGGGQLSHLLNATKSNPNILQATFDLSNNRLSDKAGLTTFCKSLSECSNLQSLCLREMDIVKTSVVNLITALAAAHSLTYLDLSGLFKESKEKDSTTATLEALVQAVNSHPNLRELTIDGKGQNVLGRSTTVLFGMLSPSSKLRKVSLRGHGFGDAVAKELFDCLRWNTSLLSLDIDNNSTNIVSWLACKRCLAANRTLVEIVYPSNDVLRILSKDKNLHESVRKVFGKISKYTENNKNGILDERGESYSKYPVAFKTRLTRSAHKSAFVVTDSNGVQREASGTLSSPYREASNTLSSPYASPSLSVSLSSSTSSTPGSPALYSSGAYDVTPPPHPPDEGGACARPPPPPPFISLPPRPPPRRRPVEDDE